MKNLLFFLTLLLAAGSVDAQQSLVASRPDSLATAQAAPGLMTRVSATAAPDTAAAIHRLFAGRRLRRNLIASGLGAGALVGALISGSSENDGGSSSGGGGYGSIGGGGLSFDGADYLLLYAIPAVPLILLDYVVYANYSRKREAWVIEEFQAHRLPAKLRHKLKPRYFR